MKPLQRHKRFEKHFRQRIAGDQKLVAQFEKRLSLFLDGSRGWPLNDHPLTGKLVGQRAFSVTGNIRVIYTETDEFVIFTDIGTHNQVY